MAATSSKQFSLTGWRLLLADLGINAANVLRRADLPEDLLARDDARVDTPSYFALFRAVQAEAGDPLLPIRSVEAVSMEAFDPAIFAAICSPDLNTALERLSQYKRLVCPMRLDVERTEHSTRVELHWLEAQTDVPDPLIATELLFFVKLARLGTRADIKPLALQSPVDVECSEAIAEYTGCRVDRGKFVSITFSAGDAARPFLSSNESLWTFFEPELRRRLAQLDAEASTAERVRASLLELLPSGLASADAVARRLGVSKRTLQRKLHAESESFQHLLDSTREELARHYLGSSSMSGAEISFLLGYEDPNSFFRAFHAWTGQTPERVRAELRH